VLVASWRSVSFLAWVVMESVRVAVEVEDVGAVEEALGHGGDDGGVVEDLASGGDATVGGRWSGQCCC